ncbi:MAG: 5-formyltetrahydrofolate cyclo-ligase [Candidatus Omnitrophica bacterium]|nr:5-formyltetrahydrofolate cyclo-ligase [Candidatus Omnitrophota bacterium]
MASVWFGATFKDYMATVIIMEKKELRKKLLDQLLSLTKEEIKRRSENVEKILSELPLYKEAKVIMGYFPLNGEVDVLEMFRKAWGDKRFCFPVMDTEKKDLRVFEVTNLSGCFVSGPYGVMQPDPAQTKEIDVSQLDMVIVPGIGFDRNKNRLGRGAGFYDRFLGKISAPVSKIGVAFDFQILDDLPVHLPFDQKVDVVVSEKYFI